MTTAAWPMVALRDTGTEVQIGPFGSLLHESDYVSAGVPIVNPTHIVDGQIKASDSHTVSAQKLKDLHRYVLDEGDVVMGRRGEMGRCAVVGAAESGFVCGSGSLILRPDPHRMSAEFLQAYLSGDDAKRTLLHRSLGVTMANLNSEIVETLPVPMPPIEEQRRIAMVLDKADELRAKRRVALTQLDTLTESIFLDMFGNPADNPKAWPITPFGEEVKAIRYGTGSPPPYVEEGVPFIRATNIKGGTVSSKDMKRISTAAAAVLSKCRLSAGNLIVVRSGVNTGDCAVVPSEYDGACVAFDMIAELPTASAVFFNFIINSPYGKRVMAPLTRRAAQPHLNAQQLRSLQFISPPSATRELFAAELSRLDEQRERNREASLALDNLFASLQQRAFRGEL